jgi:hypothetical protein
LSENKQNIVIKDAAGTKHVIAVKNINSKQKQQESLMPDPVSNSLTEQDLADVAEFLFPVQKTTKVH